MTTGSADGIPERGSSDHLMTSSSRSALTSDEQRWLEIVVRLRHHPDSETSSYFRAAGLQVTPAVVGLLVSGKAGLIAEALHVQVSILGTGDTLPVPPELGGNVESITPAKPRRLHKE